MKKNVIKEEVKEAIIELMSTREGKEAFGPLMFDAVGQYIKSYRLQYEKHHRDGTIEKIDKIGDILSYIVEWISKSEGALRGVQVDASKARNSATQARNIIAMAVSKKEKYDQTTKNKELSR